MSSPFPKQTVYHSALVKESPVTVTVTSDVLKSKYKNDDGSEKFYVQFTLDGTKHDLNLENQQCEDAMRDLKGHTVTITATGSRDDAALDVQPCDGPAPQRTAPTQRQQPPQRSAAPARQQPQGGGPWVPEGMAVGNAITNACANITARGEEITEDAVHDIATRILRVAYKLGRGQFYTPQQNERQQQPAQPSRQAAPLPQPGSNERRAPAPTRQPGEDVDSDLHESSVPF